MKQIHKNQDGVVHHLGLLLLLFAVLGVLVFAGYKVFQARESANAESWEVVAEYFMNPGEFTITACRVNEDTAKVFVKNDSNQTLKVSTGSAIANVSANSDSGPLMSKWTGNISWNNISNYEYNIDGTGAAYSSC